MHNRGFTFHCHLTSGQGKGLENCMCGPWHPTATPENQPDQGRQHPDSMAESLNGSPKLNKASRGTSVTYLKR